MVRLYEWNPRRKRAPGPIGRVITYGPRISNFGDRLGPLIADRVLARHGIANRRRRGPRLFSVGSVLHFARTGDSVWGSGRNGKIGDGMHRFASLDVRATRGPHTRAFLAERGISAPAVYGDPAVLMAELFPEWARSSGRPSGPVFVPNLNDVSHPDDLEVVSPIGDVGAIVRRIASAEFVVSSSLHGVVIAEAYGVPARMVVPHGESLFKYRDYYAGTGRPDEAFARSAAEAIAAGPSVPPVVDTAALLDAFPLDLWKDPSR